MVVIDDCDKKLFVEFLQLYSEKSVVSEAN